MRDLKFRAWDGKRMLNRTLFDRNWYASEDEMVRVAMPNDIRTMKSIMQYISVKDRDKQDIYEDDILENNKGHRFVVGFGGIAFNYKGITPFANGRVEFSFDTITSSHVTEMLEMKVIGNKHENPELLERK